MSKQTDKFVEAMTIAAPEEWKRFAAMMTWVYRRGGVAHHKEILTWFEELPTRTAWVDLRTKINTRRRLLKRRREDEKRERNKARRREYMREYMTRYRERRDETA